MTDIFDAAEQVEQRQRDTALARARQVTPEPEQLVVSGVVLCIDCDDEVQPERLRAKPNAARCIHCQSIWERKHGR
jgi:DnaK suppressor protein